MPVAVLALSAVLAAAPVPPGREDLFRDPLPPGAVCRVGTVRLRAPEGMSRLAFTPDGKFLVTAREAYPLRVWDAATGALVREIPTALDDGSNDPRGEGKRWPEWTLALAFPPGERRLHVLTGSGTLRACDLADGTWGEPLARGSRLDHDRIPLIFRYGDALPDGNHFTFTYGDGSVPWVTEVLAVGKDKPVRRLDDTTHGWARAPGAGARRLAARAKDWTVAVWDLEAGKVLRTHTPPHGKIHGFTISPDGNTLVAVCGPEAEGKVYVGDPAPPGTALYGWDAVTGKELFRTPDWPSHSVRHSPSGTWVISKLGTEVLLADAATGKLVRRLRGHGGSSLAGHAFSPDGKRLAVAGEDRTAIVWDLTTGKPALDFDSPRGAVSVLAFSPDGKTLVVGGRDDRAGGLWGATTGARVGRPAADGRPAGYPLAAAFTPDGRHVLVGYSPSRGKGDEWSAAARLWAAADGKLVREFPCHGDWVRQVAVSPDGKELVTGEYGAGKLRRWELDTGKLTKEVRNAVSIFCFPKPGEVAGFGPARAGNGYASADPFGDAAGRTWHPSPGQPIDPRLLSPDGRVVVVREAGRAGDRLVLRLVTTGEVVCEPRTPHLTSASPLAFSADGRTLAVTGYAGDDKGNPVAVFDAATGEEVRAFRGHAGPVYALAFSPDGKRLASGSADCTVLVWDLTAKP